MTDVSTTSSNGARPTDTEVQGAAFFDVDRTLIAGASALRLARPFRRHGMLTRRQQVRAAMLQLGFMLRGADDAGIERFTVTAKQLIAGWNQADVSAIIATELEKHVQPVVFREALDRIEMHRRMGHKVYAVSATMREIIEPLAELLGLDGAVASQMSAVDGRYTGDLDIVCYGAGKAEQLRKFAELNDIDLSHSYAYSDSISDELFLRAVGRAYAVNPDKALRRLAEREGWGILFFRNRVVVPVHRRRSTHVGALGIASLAVAAALLRRRAAAR